MGTQTARSNLGGSGRPAHASRARKVARDPRRQDAVALLSADALAVVRPSLKRVAAAGGVSLSRASRWCSEGKGSPVHDFYSLLDALLTDGSEDSAAAAASLIAHAETLLVRSTMTADTPELVRRFWSLVNEETQREADENSAFGRFAATGNLKEFARALKLESATQIRLASICEELDERGIDPRAVV